MGLTSVKPLARTPVTNIRIGLHEGASRASARGASVARSLNAPTTNTIGGPCPPDRTRWRFHL
jgi:phosphatidylethanolamine-binding protein (PEBP) family uncharacterized protein